MLTEQSFGHYPQPQQHKYSYIHTENSTHIHQPSEPFWFVFSPSLFPRRPPRNSPSHVPSFLPLSLPYYAPTSESRGKRRRPVSSDSGGVGSGDGSDAGLVPGLPPALALSMLSHLLAGGNGNAATTMARDAIMADDGASVSLEVWIMLTNVRYCTVEYRRCTVYL